MIKTRLIRLLSHAKRYIVFQVVWKWLSLICQVVIMASGALLAMIALSVCRIRAVCELEHTVWE